MIWISGSVVVSGFAGAVLCVLFCTSRIEVLPVVVSASMLAHESSGAGSTERSLVRSVYCGAKQAKMSGRMLVEILEDNIGPLRGMDMMNASSTSDHFVLGTSLLPTSKCIVK